eukprot:TRINITY_DN101988_c0_g1_i1.p1 TRINITY_DN101988_c0_g1~~TRINITY_DN101988_c0_g1_i1.p1  ORF type:complete len:178 (+),score=52.08 TRINITY_DN101988_c0_g1_i1:147-680(+)
MGTPSGSKNQSLFMDRLQVNGFYEFDGGAYYGPGTEEADSHYDKKKRQDAQLEKSMKTVEANEFRALTSEARIGKQLERSALSSLTPAKPASRGSVGPALPTQADKRKLPAFKVKTKDGAAEEPTEKKARSAEEAPTASPVASASPAEASPAGGGGGGALGGLMGYGSDDDSDEDDE